MMANPAIGTALLLNMHAQTEGTPCAELDGVGARHFTELLAWQLADELRQLIHEITDAGGAARAFGFRDQIRKAADSVSANIAEGFGRYGHVEFARFLTIAKASLDETESHLIGGGRRGYFSEEQVATARQYVKRTNVAVLRLLKHLRHTSAPDPFAPPAQT